MELLVLKIVPKDLKSMDLMACWKGRVYPVTQVDATGAGDSYDAAFICGLAEGKNVKKQRRWVQQPEH